MNATNAIATKPAREDFPVPEGLRAQGIRLRHQTEADLELIRTLYIDIRWDELQQVPWSEQEKLAFLSDQFALQYTHYQKHYVGTEFYIIEQNGQPIGRFYVDRLSPTEIRVVDLAFFRQHTGQGFGSAMLRAVQEQAAAAGLPATLHVEVFNPARRLYARMGFVDVETRGPYVFVRWTPPTPQA